MTVDVSVVIVTYNSRRHIDRCLHSLREHTRGVTYEVIVVDNASADGTADSVAATGPSVRLLRRRTNGGLSRALNEGVVASSGRYLMALNPDTRMEHDALAPLAAHLRDHPDVGVVAPKLLDDDGELQFSCRAFPGYATALFGRYSLLTSLLPGNRFSRRYLLSDFDHTTTRDVDWVSGAAMMFPRELFDRLGGWDASFFMFNEDVDFCKRVHNAGMRVVYLPDATVYHEIGVSKRAPSRIVLERHKSMWRYYRKHLRGNVVQDAVTGAGIAARCVFGLGTQTARNVVGRRLRAHPGRTSMRPYD